MTQYNTLSDLFAGVAESIREKEGSTALINPQDFPQRIKDLQIGGGGESSEIPVIGDGKTYLYIDIPHRNLRTVTLYFNQTKANGVTVNMGDGSSYTASSTGNCSVTHTYSNTGNYVISFNPASDCTLSLGWGASSSCVMGPTGNNYMGNSSILVGAEIGTHKEVLSSYTFNYCTALKFVYIHDGITSFIRDVFAYCYSLEEVRLPETLVEIMQYAFQHCYSLKKVVIPNSVEATSSNLFYYCGALKTIIIGEKFRACQSYFLGYARAISALYCPPSVTSVNSYAFYNASSLRLLDFSDHTAVPSLVNTSAFTNVASDCKIIVPDDLYDAWIAKTNWSSHSSKIVKKSVWDAENT